MAFLLVISLVCQSSCFCHLHNPLPSLYEVVWCSIEINISVCPTVCSSICLSDCNITGFFLMVKSLLFITSECYSTAWHNVHKYTVFPVCLQQIKVSHIILMQYCYNKIPTSSLAVHIMFHFNDHLWQLWQLDPHTMCYVQSLSGYKCTL